MTKGKNDGIKCQTGVKIFVFPMKELISQQFSTPVEQSEEYGKIEEEFTPLFDIGELYLQYHGSCKIMIVIDLDIS